MEGCMCTQVCNAAPPLLTGGASVPGLAGLASGPQARDVHMCMRCTHVYADPTREWTAGMRCACTYIGYIHVYAA